MVNWEKDDQLQHEQSLQQTDSITEGRVLVPNLEGLREKQQQQNMVDTFDEVSKYYYQDYYLTNKCSWRLWGPMEAGK